MSSQQRRDPSVTLKRGREKSVLRHHPWIFSGAIADVAGRPEPGETVRIRTSSGELIGTGAYSGDSSIRVRVWSRKPDIRIDEEFFAGRLGRAVLVRERLALMDPEGACRLVNAESDGLPGLVVDRYHDTAVCQFLSAGIERHRETITNLLMGIDGVERVFERSDVSVRRKEGLDLRTGLVAGTEPDPLIEITEDGRRYLVDVRSGHKTGFYLDQRVNRTLVQREAADRAVLNCFSYTGGFGVAAAIGGASEVVNVDTSADVLDLASRNAGLNGAGSRFQTVQADVFAQLRTWRNEDRRFDLIILDPPKFAESKSHVEKACRGYKDINLLAFRLLAPGGLLFTFSCSGAISDELFRKVIADAAIDSGRDTRILARLDESPDHATPPTFPEGHYLKGLKLQVEDSWS